MRVAVDALSLGTGGGRVYLTHVLEQIAAVNLEVDFTVYGLSQRASDFEDAQENIDFHTIPFKHSSTVTRLLWQHFVLPVKIARASVSIILLPGGSSLLPSRVLGVPSVFVGQNMLAVDPYAIHYYRGNWRKRIWLFYLRWITAYSCRVANHTIAISETLRQAIIENLGISPERVTTVHYGMDHDLFYLQPKKKVEGIYQSLGLPSGYLLSVSSIFCYKNFLNLIRAYHRLKQKGGISAPLVIVGEVKEEQHYHKILQEIERLELQDSVYMPGRIEHKLLPSLYSGAILYIFPSMCESFGLTPLEAMSCGTPVVASNISAMPEICGDAAVYFNPNDPEDIANAVLRILNDQVLQQELIARGLKRAGQFSWEKAARETWRILAETANQ